MQTSHYKPVLCDCVKLKVHFLTYQNYDIEYILMKFVVGSIVALAIGPPINV